MLLPLFATQILAPSKATPTGVPPTLNVPRLAPSVDRSLVALLLPKFATQILFPSKARPAGAVPTAKVPRTAPSLARSPRVNMGKLFPLPKILPFTYCSWFVVSLALYCG